jgi:tetratricopeptide (TPR) repeat protein
MGNIFFSQGKFANAIKMYRMAMDQVGAGNKETKFRMMRNIGIAFIKMGSYREAITSLESVMDNIPDYVTGPPTRPPPPPFSFALTLGSFQLDRRVLRHQQHGQHAQGFHPHDPHPRRRHRTPSPSPVDV